MKTICVVTGSRAEFGLLKPLLNQLRNLLDTQLLIAVTGSHLDEAFGNTWTEIVSSGFIIDEKIRLSLGNDSKVAMAKATAEAIGKFADYFSARRPDIVVVLGDRYEIFGASYAAAMLGIPIAHIHGGETTEGAVDEFLRHSITKMSSLHFTACEKYRRRVVQLGEDPDTVFNVGALGVENIINLPEISALDVSNAVGTHLESKQYAVVVFHPVTRDSDPPTKQVNELINALDKHPELKYLIIQSNADSGGQMINALWYECVKTHSKWAVVPSLSPEIYLVALKNSAGLIGNSSSGIIEAPSLHIPSINIGDRQKGREMSCSIINCRPLEYDIDNAINKMLSKEFLNYVEMSEGLFGVGDTSNKIVRIISDFLFNDKLTIKKKFFDVMFKV